MNTPSLKDAQRYVGMAYEDGVFDCSDLVALVQRELFGHDLKLPAHADRPGGRAGRRNVMRDMSKALAQPLDEPALGAVVIMQQPADDGRGMVWHLGVMFTDGQEWWVLHNVNTLGGVWLHRLRELGRLGIQVEGYYTCI